jgi:hypothetical protein
MEWFINKKTMEKVQNLKNSNTTPSSKTFRDELKNVLPHEDSAVLGRCHNEYSVLLIYQRTKQRVSSKQTNTDKHK